MDVLALLLNNWDTVTLIVTNILALFVPTPRRKAKKLADLKGIR